MAPWLRSSVILDRSLTSLDLFPYVYSGRMDWVVSYFTDSKMYGLWVVAVIFHILISLNLECIYNNYNQFCLTIITGIVIFLPAFTIYGRLEPMKSIK